jgi:uncharacterized protein YjbJ (UPF0337 family)
MADIKEATGRVKQAAGTLTDDKDLEREGKIDRATGSAKDALDKGSDKIKRFVNNDRH